MMASIVVAVSVRPQSAGRSLMETWIGAVPPVRLYGLSTDTRFMADSTDMAREGRS